MAETDGKNDRSMAVALTYAEGSGAPRVVAKGRGLIAEEIIKRAHEYGVYVHESPELVALLMQVDLDDHIPPQLYVAIAELLAWLYLVEEQGLAAAPPPPRFRPESQAAGDGVAAGAALSEQAKQRSKVA